MRHIYQDSDVEKVEMEIIECDCGFNLGIDSTFLEQVGDIKMKCPSCHTQIDTAKVIQ